MSWGIVAGAAVGVVGAAMSSDAAGDAAEGQQQAAQQANALQYQMHRENVALQQPALNAGNSARDRLMYLMGLSPTGTSNSAPKPTYESLRGQMLGQFTRSQTAGPGTGSQGMNAGGRQLYDRWTQGVTDPAQLASIRESVMQQQPGPLMGVTGSGDNVYGDAPQSYVDETGLDTAIRSRLAEQDAAAAAQQAQAEADPEYGRLTDQFTFNQYRPERYNPNQFSFSNEDFYRDPSYQWRLQQGQTALDRMGAASGRFLSGNQLQASSNYNQGAASQEYQSAYQRALGTFGTNETGRFNAFNTNETNRSNAFNTGEANRFNAYQENFRNTINPLLSLSGSGQLASNGLMQANTQVAGTIGNNLIGASNAAGAAQVAGANAINQGLGNAVNGYQQNQLMNRIFPTGVNSNPTISAANQASFDSLGQSNNWWGTGG